MKKVAIIGTVGVPAKYGGFETLVENIIGDNCSTDVEYTVYCSGKSVTDKPKEYKGAKLEYVPLNANGAQSIPYDIISILKAIRKNDTLLILGVSGAFILPIVRMFSKTKIVVNIDGLEHRRDKWSSRTRKLLKTLEAIAVKNSDVVVSDNKAIQDYVKQEYGKDSELIAYGGDHVVVDTTSIDASVIDKYKLDKDNYFFSVCRIEPENNVHVTLEAFSKSQQKLIFVGNWNKSQYGTDLKTKYQQYDNITILDPIYNIDNLSVMRSHCRGFIHGHSAGGTNPSLVEAMFFGKPILCFDVNYNRESTENKAQFFKDTNDLIAILKRNEHRGAEAMKEIAERRYIWAKIAAQYEAIY